MTPTKLQRLCKRHGYDITVNTPGAAKNRVTIARIMFARPQTVLNYINGSRSIDPARYKLLGIYFGDEQAVKDADGCAGRFGR